MSFVELLRILPEIVSNFVQYTPPDEVDPLKAAQESFAANPSKWIMTVNILAASILDQSEIPQGSQTAIDALIPENPIDFDMDKIGQLLTHLEINTQYLNGNHLRDLYEIEPRAWITLMQKISYEALETIRSRFARVDEIGLSETIAFLIKASNPTKP